MARHKKTALEPTALPDVPAAPLVSAEALLNAERRTIERVRSVIEKTGAFRTHAGYSAISEMSQIAVLDDVLKTGEYKGLPYTDEHGNQLCTNDIREFCTHYLGVSYNTLAEKKQRIAQVGEQGYRQAQKMGFTNKHWRAYGMLPDDQKQIIDQAMHAEDKDAIFDILEDVMAKHARQKEALTKEIDDLKGTVEAQEQLIDKKNQKIDEQHKRMLAEKKRAKDWAARVFDIGQESTNHALTALQGMDQLHVMRDVIQTEDFGADQESAVPAMARVYHHAVLEVFKEASRLLAASEEQFIGYVEDPVPIHDMAKILGIEGADNEASE